MGRVDEAMRRAAGEPVETPVPPVRHTLSAETDVATAVEEPPIDVPPAAAMSERLDARLAAKVVIDRTMTPSCREQYRRLAATLHQRQLVDGLKVVMIASAAVGEGKTLTAANTALTLSESYQRSVLLIDADLRRPSLNTVFGLNGSPGLSDGLLSAGQWEPPLHDVSPLLTLLPAGQPNSDPMAGLTSPRMHQLLEDARRTFTWVIIDTPPVGLLSDANLLVSMVDGVVLVVEAGVTPYDLVRRAVDAIGSERMLGVVLNRATTAPHAYGYHYDYYHSHHQTPAKVKAT